MKKYLLLLIASFAMNLAATAQDVKKPAEKPLPPTAEQLAECRCKKLMNDLALDDATRAKFSPLYLEYCKKMNALRQQMQRPQKKQSEMSDAEVDQMLKARFAHSRKVLDLREEYYGKFRKMLSARQVQRVYKAEQAEKGRFGAEQKARNGQRPGNARAQQRPHHGAKAQPKAKAGACPKGKAQCTNPTGSCAQCKEPCKK